MQSCPLLCTPEDSWRHTTGLARSFLPHTAEGSLSHHTSSTSPSGSQQSTATTDDDGPEIEDEVQDEIQVSANRPGPTRTSDHRPEQINVKSGPGDYFCSFVWKPSTRLPALSRLLMVGEAKAPHKLTRASIQSVIGENDTTISTAQFLQHVGRDQTGPRYHNQMWLSAVAAQVYTQLIHYKKRYGYITTGESYIIVRIRPNNPTSLDYLFLPAASRQHSQAGQLDWLAATPLARLSCLALLSLFGDGDLAEAEVDQAKTTTVVWRTPRLREQSLESGDSKARSPTTVATNDSDPDRTEMRGGRRGHEGTAQSSRKRRYSDGPCPGPGPELANEPTRTNRASLATSPACFEAVSISTPPTPGPCQRSLLPTCLEPPDIQCQGQTSSSIDTVLFCNHDCIRVLVAGPNEASPDPSCPNWAMHQQNPEPPTSASQLRALARSSVALPSYVNGDSDSDSFGPFVRDDFTTANAVYTGQYGSRSAIFKVRIEPGGYILVAKAARAPKAVRWLRHEEKVYKMLRTLQGRSIPICAGLVRPSKPTDQQEASRLRTRFSPFLLLSWAGRPLSWSLRLPAEPADSDKRAWLDRVRAGVQAALQQVHEQGFLQTDAESRNFVEFDSRVFLLDFERALSKGHFCRRLAGGPDGYDEAFKRACENEMACCLALLDEQIARKFKVEVSSLGR